MALRESEAYNRSIVESSNDCLMVLSTEGRILEMVAPGRRLMEVKDFEQIRNADWLSFWKDESAEAASGAVAAARRGETGRFQGPCPTMAGTLKWWDVMVTPIVNPDGTVERLLGYPATLPRANRPNRTCSWQTRLPPAPATPKAISSRAWATKYAGRSMPSSRFRPAHGARRPDRR